MNLPYIYNYGGIIVTKNLIVKAVSVMMAVMLMGSVLSSCTNKAEQEPPKADFYKKFSVKEKASVKPVALNGEQAFKGKEGDVIELSFSEPTEVNTVVLMEEGDNILEFEIALKEDDEKDYETVYKQDKVGPFRYCAFEDETVENIRITVKKAKNGQFTLNELDVLNASHSRTDFQVRSYVIADRILDKSEIDPEHLDVITDLILFGAVTFNEEGHLVENEFEYNGKKLLGKEVLKLAIKNINETKGENKPRIFVNILGPDGDVESKEEKHNIVFKKHSKTLISEIDSLIKELDLDGIYFDYEYPYKKSGWKAYSSFLCKLNKGLPEEKIIGVALGPWGLCLSKKAQEAVDNYEIMTYDMFDDDGYHATFQTATNGMKFAWRQNLDVRKCTIGLPFYGRPTDKAAVWTDYKSSYKEQGKFGNLDSKPLEQAVVENGEEKTVQVAPRYLNSYQMIYDKTAFALDSGVGGVMIWHYSCDTKTDTELSLFDAIGEAIEDRKA